MKTVQQNGFKIYLFFVLLKPVLNIFIYFFYMIRVLPISLPSDSLSLPPMSAVCFCISVALKFLLISRGC